jgi:hypothetical protein
LSWEIRGAVAFFINLFEFAFCFWDRGVVPKLLWYIENILLLLFDEMLALLVVGSTAPGIGMFLLGCSELIQVGVLL